MAARRSAIEVAMSHGFPASSVVSDLVGITTDRRTKLFCGITSCWRRYRRGAYR
jgi:hypothetical protein